MINEMTEDWIHRVEHVTVEIQQQCINPDYAVLSWKAQAQAWSASQVLEHIIKVNTSYFPIIESLHNGTYRPSWTAKIPLFPRMMGKLILNSVKPSNTRKVSTFQIWEPATSALPLSIVEDFIKHQDELQQLILSSADLLSRQVIISSPASSTITYSLEDAFHIIVTHEERHLSQFQRVLNLAEKSIMP